MKKKKKSGFTIVYIVVGLISIYVVLTLTGTIRLFSITTASSRPTLEVGDRIVASRFVSPDRYDLIVYTYYDSVMQEKVHHIFRLCGMPGDTVEIKSGTLFVNNKLPGKKFDICVPYAVAADAVEKINSLIELNEDDVEFPAGPDKAVVILSNAGCATLNENKIGFDRWVVPAHQKNGYISKIYNHDWNEDNFGPIVVPANHYFVLGDNRNRAMDSRYTGMVPFSEFFGTVIVQ